jgi:hypothetical protein
MLFKERKKLLRQFSVWTAVHDCHIQQFLDPFNPTVYYGWTAVSRRDILVTFGL